MITKMTAQDLYSFLSEYSEEQREKMTLEVVCHQYVHHRLEAGSIHTLTETGDRRLIFRVNAVSYEGDD